MNYTWISTDNYLGTSIHLSIRIGFTFLVFFYYMLDKVSTSNYPTIGRLLGVVQPLDDYYSFLALQIR